jgi:glutamate carboxypeptidase
MGQLDRSMSVNYEAVKGSLRALLPDFLADLQTLVELESPSAHPTELNRIADHLVGRFGAAGGEVSLVENPPGSRHVRAFFPSQSGPDKPPGLLLCHYDTVWPLGTLKTHPFRLANGRAYGPGIYDMKASILMAEYALRAMQRYSLPLPRPLVLLLTSDEEIGSPGARALIIREARAAEYVLVLEPPANNGALKTARKGIGSFKIAIEGRAAHAGTQPEQGVSAVTELAHLILVLSQLNDQERGSTVNVGVVRGGTRRNVIPARAEAEVDVRAWTLEEAARLEGRIRGLQPVQAGAVLKVTGGFGRPPMERSPAIAGLFQRAHEIGLSLGIHLKETSTGGGSDANLTAALGVPTLDGLGAIGDGAHADHEQIEIDPLPERMALLAALFCYL